MGLFDFTFWQSFLANLFATVVGVGIGIPVALWINRLVESGTERAKKTKILSSLLIELKSNHNVLAHWKQQWQSGKTLGLTSEMYVLINSSDEIWSAFSDGGELQWIKDPLLLSTIANAYWQIKRMRQMSDLIFYGNNLTEDVLEGLSTYWRSSLHGAEKSVEDVIRKIEEQLSS